MYFTGSVLLSGGAFKPRAFYMYYKCSVGLSGGESKPRAVCIFNCN